MGPRWIKKIAEIPNGELSLRKGRFWISSSYSQRFDKYPYVNRWWNLKIRWYVRLKIYVAEIVWRCSGIFFGTFWGAYTVIHVNSTVIVCWTVIFSISIHLPSATLTYPKVWHGSPENGTKRNRRFLNLRMWMAGKLAPVKMYFLLRMGIAHWYVSFIRG